jgi:hypothetical protein
MQGLAVKPNHTLGYSLVFWIGLMEDGNLDLFYDGKPLDFMEKSMLSCRFSL